MAVRDLYLLLILIALGSCICLSASALVIVGFPLKSSPPQGPYQDEEFLDLANDTIYAYTNETLPNGTDLLTLSTIQQQLSRMNISPELHPEATQINAFLYYTTKAGEEFEEALSITGKAYSPAYRDTSAYADAYEYQNASRVVWEKIKERYPGIVPYKLTEPSKPFSSNEDPNFTWPPVSPFATTASLIS
jgi:hypothetical protein